MADADIWGTAVQRLIVDSIPAMNCNKKFKHGFWAAGKLALLFSGASFFCVPLCFGGAFIFQPAGFVTWV